MTTLLTREPDLTGTVPEQSAPSAPATTAPEPTAPSPTAPGPTAPATTPATTAPAVRARASRLRLTGALSRSDCSWLAPELEELAASGATAVEVDLSDVQSVDAAVARLLLRTSWHLGDPGRTLLLLHPRPQVRRVLRFYGAGGLVVR